MTQRATHDERDESTAGRGAQVLRTRLTLRAGAPGTKRLLAFFGERLLRVRYRYDNERRVRLTTVELIVDERDLHAPISPMPSIYEAWMCAVDVASLAQANEERRSRRTMPAALAPYRGGRFSTGGNGDVHGIFFIDHHGQQHSIGEMSEPHAQHITDALNAVLRRGAATRR